MKSFIRFYSDKKCEIKKFLSSFLNNNNNNNNNNNDDNNIKKKNKNNYNFKNIKDNILEYTINYDNPIEMTDLIGAFIDNKDSFKINMWVCLDEGLLINVTEHNANEIIKYLFERYPY